jgi:hypothetical protein
MGIITLYSGFQDFAALLRVKAVEKNHDLVEIVTNLLRLLSKTARA